MCPRWCKSIFAGLLIVWIFVSSLLAVSPTLHQWLHDDAAQSSHQCAITLFQQQQILPSEPQVAAFVAEVGFVFHLPLHSAPPLTSVDYFCAPGRAPPVLSSLS